MKIAAVLSLIIVVCLPLHPQVSLKSDEVVQNTYRLDIVNEARYELRTYGEATAIQFNGYSDESKGGNYILPQQDLFIAIPPNTDPEIVFNATQTNRIKARPEINPIVQ